MLFFLRLLLWIANWNHTFAIEIKSSIETEEKLSANTKKYLNLRNDKNCKGAIFYLGNISLTVNGIKYVSWRDWGNFVDAL